MRNVWESHLDSELAFWRRWLTEPLFDKLRSARLAEMNDFPRYYIDQTERAPGERVRVLDVGSGPISTLGDAADGYDVELVCVDALGVQYNALLDEYGFTNLPRIIPLKGEDVESRFGPASFDIVHTANALDHFEDPFLAFEKMYAVCRTGGALIVISVENEGEHQKYLGLHQWNLRADDDGIWLGSRTSTRNLRDVTNSNDIYSWSIIHETAEFRVFCAIVKKRS